MILYYSCITYINEGFNHGCILRCSLFKYCVYLCVWLAHLQIRGFDDLYQLTSLKSFNDHYHNIIKVVKSLPVAPWAWCFLLLTTITTTPPLKLLWSMRCLSASIMSIANNKIIVQFITIPAVKVTVLYWSISNRVELFYNNMYGKLKVWLLPYQPFIILWSCFPSRLCEQCYYIFLATYKVKYLLSYAPFLILMGACYISFLNNY